MKDILNSLYGSYAGRCILKPFTSKGFANLMGSIMSSRISKVFISGFIKRNGIDMSDYENREFHSFNDVFTRKLAKGKRVADMSPDSFISPCDGMLSVYSIEADGNFPVKNVNYSIESLTHNTSLSKEFEGGFCLVFRLTSADYHRYIYIDNAEKDGNIYIDGIFNCVRPAAVGNTRVYAENCREYTVMLTENFGKIVQIEVGAMSVGRITNKDGKGKVFRGWEKGYFEFGGSTIILLLKKDVIELKPVIIASSALGDEYRVRIGEKIGERIQERRKNFGTQ